MCCLQGRNLAFNFSSGGNRTGCLTLLGIGDFDTCRQPEEVYYYPHKLTLKANFEFTETWDHKEIGSIGTKTAGNTSVYFEEKVEVIIGLY